MQGGRSRSRSRSRQRKALETAVDMAKDANMDIIKYPCKGDKCERVFPRFMLSKGAKKCWYCQGYTSRKDYFENQLDTIRTERSALGVQERLWDHLLHEHR